MVGAKYLITIGFAAASLCAGQAIERLMEAVADAAAWPESPVMSPDGRTLAFIKSGEILLRSLGSGELVSIAKDDPNLGSGSLAELQWSPDGQRIAFSRFYCTLCAHKLFWVNATGGAEFPLGDVCAGQPSWTPNGRNLIMAESVGDEEDCQLALIPADGSKRTVLVAKEGDRAAVSPDGKRLVYAAGNVLKLAQLTPDFRVAGPAIPIASEPHAISSIHWAPDGSTVVYQSWTDGATYTRILPFGGPPRLFDLGGEIEITQILVDGSALGVESISSRSLRRIDQKEAIETEEKIRDIPWTDSTIAVSPTGEFMAFVTAKYGPSQIWISKIDGSNDRVLVTTIPPYLDYGDNTMVGEMSWSPDGQWIAFLTNPGIGHGVDDARLFLAPSGGGTLRTLVQDCSLDGRPVPWSTDSKSVFIAREARSETDFTTSYFQVDILSGKETAVSESALPPRPMAPVGADNPQLVQSGRYVYYGNLGDQKSRIVIVHGLVNQ